MDNEIRPRRQAAGLSQQALAKRCGLTRQAVHAIETGRYIPSTAVALKLARVLGCPVEELFRLADEQVCVEAEWLGETSLISGRLRSGLARVGERLLARPLTGPMAAFTAADGLTLPAVSGRPPVGRRVAVELLIDRRLLDNTVVVLGCDPALALLGAHLTRRYPAFRLMWTHRSSLMALRLLGQGEAHAAGTHLWDPESGDYNVPYVRHELSGRRLVVVTLFQWQQGLIVARSNPKGIDSPADLARGDIAIVNRESGSGSRMLLDAWLLRHGIATSGVCGYSREVPSHLAVAEAVANGAADTGPGILAAARLLGLDFIPIQEERYDLVIPTEFLNIPPLQALLGIAVSPPFRRELEALGGYDSSMAGTVVAELGP
jgi:molybdate-binding protein/DNA-binding XRE family transcriptional regulator